MRQVGKFDKLSDRKKEREREDNKKKCSNGVGQDGNRRENARRTFSRSALRDDGKRSCDMGGVSLCFSFLPSFLSSFYFFFFWYLLYYPIWVANAFPRENYASDLLSLLLLLLLLGLSYPVHLLVFFFVSFSFFFSSSSSSFPTHLLYR
jgi:hypothetical protein